MTVCHLGEDFEMFRGQKLHCRLLYGFILREESFTFVFEEHKTWDLRPV